MITNRNQLKVTMLWIQRFKAQIQKIEAEPDLSPTVRSLSLMSHRSQLEDLEAEVAEYLKLTGLTWEEALSLINPEKYEAPTE